jgi:hypothetical protein
MIKDTDTLTEIQASWDGVENLRGKIQRSLFASVGFLGGTFPFAAANAAHNLPFLHAISVLNVVLEALAKEGWFNCGSFFLGALLNAAKDDLQWVDYDAIREANRLRVALAHKGELLPRADCWKHIDAVKAQLVAWGIIGAN